MRQPKRLAPGFAEQQGILHPPQTTRLWRGFVGLSDRSLFPAPVFLLCKKTGAGSWTSGRSHPGGNSPPHPEAHPTFSYGKSEGELLTARPAAPA